MQKESIRPQLEPLTQAVSFSRKSSAYNASYAYHRHDGCEIYLFLSGNIRLYIEQSCFSPAHGTIAVLNSNEMHRVQCMDNTPYERIVINLQRTYLNRLSANSQSLSECFYNRPTGENNLHELSPQALQDFLSLYTSLETVTASDSAFHTAKQDAYLTLILVFLNEQFQTGATAHKNTMPAYITETMQYLDSHLDQPLRLSVLSKQFHISEDYLSAQFKHHTGLTLRAYLLDRKINSAKQLLQQGFNVTNACFGSGFNDYANFIRSFKQLTGITPGQYRASQVPPDRP